MVTEPELCPACPACGGSGYANGTLRRPCTQCAAGHERQREQEHLCVQAILERGQVPLRYQACTLDTFPDQSARAIGLVRAWVRRWDGGRGLLLVGPTGVGKTGLMVAGARALVAEALHGTWLHLVSVPDLLDNLRDAYRAEARWNAAPCVLGEWDRVLQAPLALLDDLGAETPTEWTQGRLFALINERYNALLPTCATSSYGLEELAERIGTRTLHRLIETCDIVLMHGPNLRLRGHAPGARPAAQAPRDAEEEDEASGGAAAPIPVSAPNGGVAS